MKCLSIHVIFLSLFIHLPTIPPPPLKIFIQSIRSEQETIIIPRLSISVCAHCSTEDMLIISVVKTVKKCKFDIGTTIGADRARFMQEEVVSSSGMRKALLTVRCTFLHTLKKIIPPFCIFNNC